jgi:Cu/Ag efflux pump CusA
VVVDLTAAFPGASAEEVERQVTIPLEVTLAGVPRLDHIRSQSLPGLACVRLQFRAGTDRDRARQEVVNALAAMGQPLPPGVTPQRHPATPVDQLLRYTLRGPRDREGKSVYTPADLRALQEWVLERELRIVPGVADVLAAGGVVKRYEIQPDPDRLRRYGITLAQLQTALAEANANTPGGAYVRQGRAALNVRGVGLLGGGTDPVQQVLGLKDPREAAAKLRAEEQRRVRQIRSLVVTTIKGVPVRVEDVVEGGRLAAPEAAGERGVVVGRRPLGGLVGHGRAGEPDEDDAVQGVVLLRPGEGRQRTLRAVRGRIQELNAGPGRLLPGVRIEPYYERGPASGTGEDVMWVRGSGPVNVTRERAAEQMRVVRELLLRRPEVREVVTEVGRDCADMEPVGFSLVQALVLLRPAKQWPAAAGRGRPLTWWELADDVVAELERKVEGVAWEAGVNYRDDMQQVFTAGPGEGLLKIIGPDLEGLERLAARAAAALRATDGVRDVRVMPVLGWTSLEFRVDPDKCKRWGVSVADVRNVIQAAAEATAATQMVEGEKTFDITIRLPSRLRDGEAAILDIPVDIPAGPAAPAATAPNPAGTPAPTGNPITSTPRLRLRDLVSPVSEDGSPDPKGSFLRKGAAAIYREEGRRFIAVRFHPSDKDTAGSLAETRRKLAPLFAAPYRARWEVGP